MLAWALAMLTLSGGDLRWQAPPEQCPSAEAIRAQIDAAGGLGELQVNAVVTAEPSGEWRLELRIALGEVSDARTLHDANCAALAEAAVLLVATRLDSEPAPVPVPREQPSPPLETPPQSPSPTPEAADSEPPKPASPEPRPAAPPEPAELQGFALPTGLTFAAAAGISLGTVPTPGVPSELAVGHAWPNVRVALRGRVHVAAPQELGEVGIRVVVGSAGPQVCARPRWRRLEFPLCGEVGVGGSRAVTRGPAARDRGGVWVEAGIGAGLAWFVDPRWALTAQLAGASTLQGTGYKLGDDELWNPSVVAGRVMLGVEFFVPIQIRNRPEKSQ